MIKDIRLFFRQLMSDPEMEPKKGHIAEIHLASAALLFEMIQSGENSASEWETTRSILRVTFELNDESLESLVKEAESSIRDAHDFHQFTQLINLHYDYEEKKLLLEALWKVAFADGRLDMYEEHFIRKIAGLLHMAHSDFIQAKLRAKGGA